VSAVRTVLAPTRSVAAAAGALLAGLGVAALTIGLVTEPGLTGLALWVTLIIGLGFGASLVVVGLRLLANRGGIVVDDTLDAIGLGVTSLRDTWWIPRAEVLGVRVLADARTGESIERWLALLILRSGAEVVLAESDDRSTLIHVAQRLAEAIGITSLPEEPRRDPRPIDGEATVTVHLAVRRGAALQGILFFFGVSLFVVGVAMMGQVEHEPVFGFLFGPLLALLGVALLGVTVVKRLATEEIRADGEHFEHRFRIGRWSFGDRRIQARRPRWRLRVHGLRGAHMELVGDDGCLVMAGGTTAHSDLGLAALARIPARFALAPPPGTGDDERGAGGATP